jgi:hypothetical protein
MHITVRFVLYGLPYTFDLNQLLSNHLKKVVKSPEVCCSCNAWKENATNSYQSHIIAAMLGEFEKGFSLFETVSSIYIWSKNSHSAYEKSEDGGN